MVTKRFSANAAKALAHVAALAAVASLAGCGGGGGGGGGPVAAVKPVPLAPPAKATHVNVGSGATGGANFSGLYIAIPDVHGLRVGDRSAAGGNGATVAGTGVPGTPSFTVGGKMAAGTAIPAAAALQVIAADPTGLFAVDATDPNVEKTQVLSIVASQSDSTNLLQYSSYGEYFVGTATATGGSIVDGMIFGGAPTTLPDMQNIVTAKYAGAFQGVSFANDGTVGQGKSGYSKGLDGDVALTLDATKGTVTGNVYNMQGTDAYTGVTADAGYGLAINAKVDAATGNTYQGSVNFTNASTTSGAAAVVGATQSNVIGGFYGPGAAETAGALQVQGKAPGAGLPNDLFVTGAYGAKKQ
jgi:hypothetical protein